MSDTKTPRVLRFETNVPVQLALQTTQGLRIARGRSYEMLFVTVAGQKVYFPEDVAKRITDMVKSDESFHVCKRHGKYDLWLSNEAERRRATDEAPAVREQLRAPTCEDSSRVRPSVLAFPAPPADPVERMPLKPTGTDSAQPCPVALPALRLAPAIPKGPGRVGYGLVIRHICATVKQSLVDTGLVLGDGPMQDLISTVFIAAQKEKAIDFDFGDAA